MITQAWPVLFTTICLGVGITMSLAVRGLSRWKQ